MNTKFAAVAVILVSLAPIGRGQDPKSGAEDMKNSRDFYSKVHLVAIATFSFEQGEPAQFKYDRYPNGGPERIQSGEGADFARKDGKTWLVSNDWGETGKPADAQTSKRLNNWLTVIDSRLKSEAPLKFVETKDDGDRNEFVFEESSKGKGKPPRWMFGKYKNATDENLPILDRFSGPMQLGNHVAVVDIKFSYLIAVKINDVTEVKPSPTSANTNASSSPTLLNSRDAPRHHPRRKPRSRQLRTHLRRPPTHRHRQSHQ